MHPRSAKEPPLRLLIADVNLLSSRECVLLTNCTGKKYRTSTEDPPVILPDSYGSPPDDRVADADLYNSATVAVVE